MILKNGKWEHFNNADYKGIPSMTIQVYDMKLAEVQGIMKYLRFKSRSLPHFQVKAASSERFVVIATPSTLP